MRPTIATNAAQQIRAAGGSSNPAKAARQSATKANRPFRPSESLQKHVHGAALRRGASDSTALAASSTAPFGSLAAA